MNRAGVNGVELTYRVTGTGEPLLLIGTGPIADSFAPLLRQRALGRASLITYWQRTQDGASGSEPVSFAEHAQDAAALLTRLGIARAHVAGHSTGGAIALQLALDRPDLVHSLVLLEPPLMSVPSAAAFLENAAPAVAAYAAGDGEGAMTAFLSLVCSLDPDTCRAVIDGQVPGAFARALRSAGAFFGSYLPALAEWEFGAEHAADIAQPVLSLLGTASEQLFSESHEQIRTWLPQAESCTIDGAAHLLHFQQPEPVARAIAGFVARHPMAEHAASGA